MTRLTAISIVLSLACCVAIAETRSTPYTPEELREMSTLVFEGTVTRLETAKYYGKKFPVGAQVLRVLKGSNDGDEISFAHKNPSRNVIMDSEFSDPSIGEKGIFYIREYRGQLVLIGYLKAS